MPALGTSGFQPRQCPGARSELVGLDAEPLQHADVKIAQRWRVLRIEREMLPVLEAAACEQHWQILRRVIAGVAQIAAEEDHRPIEQRLSLLLGLLQLREELGDDLHFFEFDLFELLDLAGVLPVMRQIVMPQRHAS